MLFYVSLYCLTYQVTTVDQAQTLWDTWKNSLYITELFGQVEKAPSTGQLHIQCCMRTSMKWQELQTFMGRNPHIERTRSWKKSVLYCTKEESRVLFLPSKGIMPIMKQALVYGQVKEQGILCLEDHPTQWRSYKTIRLIHADNLSSRSTLTLGYWIHGITGCGKTSYLKDLTSAYWKDPINYQWWDGYLGQPDVILDDYIPSSTFPLERFLGLCNHSPLRIEYKGGSVNFNSKRLWVTSNVHLDTYKNTFATEIWNAISRRFQVIAFEDLALIDFYM